MDVLRFATSPSFAWLLPPELWGEISPYTPGAYQSLLARDMPPADAPALAPARTIFSDDEYCSENDQKPRQVMVGDLCSPAGGVVPMRLVGYSAGEIARMQTQFAHLQSVTVKKCHITTAQAFKDIPTLRIIRCAHLADVSALGAQRVLHLESCPLVAEYDNLAGVPDLALFDMPIGRLFEVGNRRLSLQGCERLTDISGIRSLPHLDMRGCKLVTDLRPLAGVTGELVVSYMDLASLPELHACRVTLLDCDIRDVRVLKNAERVGLVTCNLVADVATLRSAKFVELTDCRGVRVITPLKHVHTLSLCSLINVKDYTCLGSQYGLSLVGCRKDSNIDYASLRHCYELELDARNVAEARRLAWKVRHCARTVF